MQQLYEAKPCERQKMSERKGWYVNGPNLNSEYTGTLPQGHDGMPRQDAERLAVLLNWAWRAGANSKMAEIRTVLGVTT